MPETDYQRRVALQRANDARARRREFRQHLKADARASHALAEWITDPPVDWLGNAEVGTVIRWLPGLGRARIKGADRAVRSLLQAAGIASETRLIRELTERQRFALADALERLV